MAQEIRVPEVSDGVVKGTVISISVAAGDKVEADQTLLEMETDKAVVAIPSPFQGVITEVKVAEGDEVKIGAVIMLGEPAGEAAADAAPRSGPAPAEERAPAPASAAAPEADAEPEAVAATAEKGKPTTPAPAVSAAGSAAAPAGGASPAVDLQTVRTGDRVAPAAPSIRRLARDLGVDIYQVQGTGPGGRIGEDDVRTFVRETMQRITGGGPLPGATGEFPGLHAQRPLPDFTRWGPVHQEPLSRVRRITADAMSYAWSTIPMVTQDDQADITGLEAFRKDFNRTAASENKLTTTAILLKVCATALKAFPQFNSSLDLAHQELIFKDYVHIGVAVDTPGGLLVPVIRDADRKGIETLAVELNALAEQTRERRISPADMEGGTFTISNLGGIGGTAFSPIVYAPQVAILGVSRAAMAPVWNGSEFRPRLMMPLSLTYDHRVIDGADGARFLRWICEALEQPLNLVMKG
ncbi:MAG: 2-oxo acid dehydrogenase subunit E2 [Candidatus Krumholzibacteriia bacterium]